MPSAPRPKGKADKIFVKVMGKPQNISDPRKTPKQRKTQERLALENVALER